jgi:hypothetical protein
VTQRDVDTAALRVGRVVLRMIQDLERLPAAEPAFGFQKISYPGGEVGLFIARNEVAALFHHAAVVHYGGVDDVTPSPEKN